MFAHELAVTRTNRMICAIVVTAAFALMCFAQTAPAQQVTMETLLDRIQIEDLLTRYYYDLSRGNAHELSEYFTADALLDVDGTVAKGRAEIEQLYQRPEPDPNAPAPEPARRGHMLLTNPIIEINGNTATAHVIWTGIMNEGIGKQPHVYEQGREDTELVKQDGNWRIKRRYITSDGRMPNRFDANYKPRDNPLHDIP
jgi:hypothetical protein